MVGRGHDVLIVGGGVAGLRAAIASHDAAIDLRLDVAVVSKVHPLRSYSAVAQGAINAAIDPADSWERQALDVIKCGDYLGDQNVVEVFCREGLAAIGELETFGVPFNQSKDGKLAQRAYGGASIPRACFVADRTGQVLLHALWEQALMRGITFYNEWYVLNLVIEGGTCCGVIALHIPSGKIHAIPAKATILATGACYSVYQSVTRVRMNTGDGTAMAYRAGVALRDMEFVQFQPTTLFGAFINIAEAARGEGGYLRNRFGERFMERYAPKMMELASRDIVSRAILSEIREGRGLDEGYVHLDLTHLPKGVLIQKLPQVCEQVRDFAGIDPTKEPIPVRPGIAHETGGINTNMDGATNVWALFAAGDCSNTGMNGANPSGGNGLVGAVLFAKKAGESAARITGGRAMPSIRPDWQRREEELMASLFHSKSRESLARIRKRLGEVMMDKVGPYREGRLLREAVDDLKRLREQYECVGVRDRSRRFNTELIEVLEMRNSLDLAEVIVASALARQESRGTHYRRDYPKRDDQNWLKHTLVYADRNGPRLGYRDVVITRFPSGVRYEMPYEG